jgi:hypothetical protein
LRRRNAYTRGIRQASRRAKAAARARVRVRVRARAPARSALSLVKRTSVKLV